MNNPKPYVSLVLERKLFKEFQDCFVDVLNTKLNISIEGDDLDYLDRVARYPLISVAKNFSNKISLPKAFKVAQKSFLQKPFSTQLFFKDVSIKLGDDNNLYLGLEVKPTEYSEYLFKTLYGISEDSYSTHKLFVVFVRVSKPSISVDEFSNLKQQLLNNLPEDHLIALGVKIKAFNDFRKAMESYLILQFAKETEN